GWPTATEQPGPPRPGYGGRGDHSRLRSRPSQLRARRAGAGPASASAWAAPGSRRANAISMPSATMVTISDDRPEETSGSGTPVIGIRPSTAAMFTIAWPTIQTVAPAAARRMKVTSTRRAVRKAGEGDPAVEQGHTQRADQPEFLADDGEDEVGRVVGHPPPLQPAGAEAHAEPATRPDRPLPLDPLHVPAGRTALRVEEGG